MQVKGQEEIRTMGELNQNRRSDFALLTLISAWRQELAKHLHVLA